MPMMEKAFNLLDEPWILATSIQGEPVTLSLTDIFTQAHKLKALSGEMPAQDIAILRLLLGVLYAVVTRMDEYRQAQEEGDDKLPIVIWKELWDKGRFSDDEIITYLHRYHENFYLIHPERPFYQVHNLDKGASYKAYKLIGDISQGEVTSVSNGKRLFKYRSDRLIQSIGYTEAARWLIYINSFDDASGKPSVRKTSMPSVGPGWLGKLGIIYATGDTLFETLMLNLSLLDRNENLWEDGLATWELETPRIGERTEIPLPNNQISLLTMQSRRIALTYTNESITGFRALGGDFFQEENAFSELMTLWKHDVNDKTKYKPKCHDATKQLWRNFSALFSNTKDGTPRPGIIEWLTTLEYEEAIVSRHVQIRSVSVSYASAQRSATKDAWEDTITINACLLSAIGEKWVERIPSLLETTDRLTNTLGVLAADIAMLLGDRDGSIYRQAAKEDAYFRLDIPFRCWLISIDPQLHYLDETCKVWLDTAQNILLNLGKELITQAGTRAYIGREVEQKKKKIQYSSPEAYKKFRWNIQKHIKEGGNGYGAT